MRVLTGITTSGIPHLGNYVGAIRPAVAASRREDVDAFYFMADYHALIKCDDPARVQHSRLAIAATWLACGLDPNKATIYRQSDIPEIPELTWLLTCVTAKGLLNRAHAYKAAVDANTSAGEDPDAGVTAGLYMYPVLMAADILAFNANKVPVGRDQVQHIEMARDIAQRFNHLYGREFFVLPEAAIEEHVATLPGLDGRKMSKSYDNTIPLFEGGAKATRAAIMRIVTDSREPGEPKDADGSALFTIFRAFADPDETAAFRADLEGGMGWGDAKQHLFARIDRELAPMRERYAHLMAHLDEVEAILMAGAARARKTSEPLLDTLREAVGLGRGAVQAPAKKEKRKKKGKQMRMVSFREQDGSFRFRMLAADGEELALSRGFADPKAAGACIQEIVAMGDTLAVVPADNAFVVTLNGASVAESPVFADADARDAGIDRLRAELAALAAEDGDA
ncbi:tryptophan--tRNA ligase [Oleiagrimonas soli]|uniref:Tryptophan--tRNA ligase n=1 Tax=Oleiagrimonas soli TaxID=1543381 RepID=A0A099CZ49_9GAMM|nr:tryptophan--tRNA ligase [Oleiagrimonas soli]KGI78887.1 tryptophan--tRNA ligase [Oleiagrimonas soli]MBB6184306.1 tryptophanyl-tRNA synthetase [Oleiagrimonas soli]